MKYIFLNFFFQKNDFAKKLKNKGFGKIDFFWIFKGSKMNRTFEIFPKKNNNAFLL